MLVLSINLLQVTPAVQLFPLYSSKERLTAGFHMSLQCGQME